ncbi:MAG TPA: GFA family protein [Steroidobacteraceae bacterium]|jgi:hypothetical protein
MHGTGTEVELTGGCLCGAVRYRIAAAPVATRACWCRACQYVGAGSGTVNAIFPTAALTIEGALAEYASPADSGHRMRRRFCPRCGTSMFANSEARPQFTGVRLGTLDDPNRINPEATIWTSAAPQWAVFDPALPRFERQPPPPGAPERR